MNSFPLNLMPFFFSYTLSNLASHSGSPIIPELILQLNTENLNLYTSMMLGTMPIPVLSITVLTDSYH